jgi:radical SAM protein with 4Fe4S-binding SPASM domain
MPRGFGFGVVSATGRVQPCGFLQVDCGNVREASFSNIWSGSAFLDMIRDESLLKGACGACGFKGACGGCRARAYEVFGDALEADPVCWYP